MLEDYCSKFYGKLFERQKVVCANNYEKARELVNWKNTVLQNWDNISVVSMHVPDVEKGPVEFGTMFNAEIVLNLTGLSSNDIGVEILMGNKKDDEVNVITFKQELDVNDIEDGNAKYTCNFSLKNVGVYDYTFRVFPKNDLLAYRMDFPLVKWL